MSFVAFDFFENRMEFVWECKVKIYGKVFFEYDESIYSQTLEFFEGSEIFT